MEDNTITQAKNLLNITANPDLLSFIAFLEKISFEFIYYPIKNFTYIRLS